MTATVLSSKGQVIIPKPVRAAHHWNAGDRLVVEDTADGVLLRPAAFFKQTTLDEVAGCSHCDKLATFDRAFIKSAKGVSPCIAVLP